MQRTFGGDRRFELDSRFLERDIVGDQDEEAVSSYARHSLSERNTGTVSPHKEDEISKSLAEEKEIAMKVLSNIFGGNFRANYSSRESQEKIPEFRYSIDSLGV